MSFDYDPDELPVTSRPSRLTAQPLPDAAPPAHPQSIAQPTPSSGPNPEAAALSETAPSTTQRTLDPSALRAENATLRTQLAEARKRELALQARVKELEASSAGGGGVSDDEREWYLSVQQSERVARLRENEAHDELISELRRQNAELRQRVTALERSLSEKGGALRRQYEAHIDALELELRKLNPDGDAIRKPMAGLRSSSPAATASSPAAPHNQYATPSRHTHQSLTNFGSGERSTRSPSGPLSASPRYRAGQQVGVPSHRYDDEPVQVPTYAQTSDGRDEHVRTVTPPHHPLHNYLQQSQLRSAPQPFTDMLGASTAPQKDRKRLL